VPYDNAKAESFMKTLKTEEVYLGGYETFTDVIHALPRFIKASTPSGIISRPGATPSFRFCSRQSRPRRASMTTSSRITSANLLFKTLVGDVKFGPLGEWAEPRVLELQFQLIRGNDLGQFKDISTQVVLVSAKYKSGDVIYPYEMAKW
jgi:transposase InsO family protein